VEQRWRCNRAIAVRLDEASFWEVVTKESPRALETYGTKRHAHLLYLSGRHKSACVIHDVMETREMPSLDR